MVNLICITCKRKVYEGFCTFIYGSEVGGVFIHIFVDHTKLKNCVNSVEIAVVDAVFLESAVACSPGKVAYTVNICFKAVKSCCKNLLLSTVFTADIDIILVSLTDVKDAFVENVFSVSLFNCRSSVNTYG